MRETGSHASWLFHLPLVRRLSGGTALDTRSSVCPPAERDKFRFDSKFRRMSQQQTHSLLFFFLATIYYLLHYSFHFSISSLKSCPPAHQQKQQNRPSNVNQATHTIFFLMK